MAAFVMPELFANNNFRNSFLISYDLNKYKLHINWKENPSILEIGYGDGGNSRNCLWPILPKSYKEFVAADISPAMLEYAKGNESLPKMEFQLLDIADEELPASFLSRFDHIFSFFTIMYAKPAEQCFRNIFKMLKCGGETFQIFTSKSPMDAVVMEFSKHPKWKKYKHEVMSSPYYKESRPEEYFEKALANAGFRDYFFDAENRVLEFNSEQKWKGIEEVVMAGFVMPELFAKSSGNAFLITHSLKKHKIQIKWKKNPSILEVGYGDGGNSRSSLWPILPRTYKEFIAADISPTMLEYAKSKELLPKMKFQLLDIGSEEVPADLLSRFDHIFSFFTIVYTKPPEKSLKNIFKMLQPGGQTFQVFPPNLPIDAVVLEFSRHPKWKKYNHDVMLSPYYGESRPEKCFENAIANAGFRDYFFHVEDRVYEFHSEQIWKDWYLSRNTVVEIIPEEELEEYKNDFFEIVRKYILTESKTENGNTVFSFKYTLCTFSATKPEA